jgi:hypothetical protein
MKKRIETRGGIRPGAGRPRTSNLVKCNFALPPETTETIERLAAEWGCSKAQAISRSVRDNRTGNLEIEDEG